MKITYQLTPRDFQEAFGPTKTKKVMTALAFALISALVISSFFMTGEQREMYLRDLYPCLAVIAAWLGIFWILPLWAAKKQFAGMPAAKSPITYEFTEDFVHCKTENGMSENSWSIYPKWREKETVFLLHTSPAVQIVIPKRAFAPGEEEQFRQLLSAKVKKHS